MRKILKTIPLIGITCLLTGCIVGGIPADEWIVSQYESMSDIKSYCEKLDDVVALYLSSGIDQETYLSSLKELDTELSDLEKNRDTQDIKPGTFTETTMAAKEGYNDIWTGLRTLVDTMESDTTVLESKDALSYLYMAYQEQMENDVNKYILGYNEAVEEE